MDQNRAADARAGLVELRSHPAPRPGIFACRGIRLAPRPVLRRRHGGGGGAAGAAPSGASCCDAICQAALFRSAGAGPGAGHRAAHHAAPSPPPAVADRRPWHQQPRPGDGAWADRACGAAGGAAGECGNPAALAGGVRRGPAGKWPEGARLGPPAPLWSRAPGATRCIGLLHRLGTLVPRLRTPAKLSNSAPPGRAAAEEKQRFDLRPHRLEA